MIQIKRSLWLSIVPGASAALIGVMALGAPSPAASLDAPAATSTVPQPALPGVAPRLPDTAALAAALPSFQDVQSSLVGQVQLAVNGVAVPVANMTTDIVSLREEEGVHILSEAYAAGQSPSVASVALELTTPAATKLTIEEAIAQQVFKALLLTYAQDHNLAVTYAEASQVCSQNVATWKSDGSPPLQAPDGGGEAAEQMLDSPNAILITQRVMSEQAAQTAIAGAALSGGQSNPALMPALKAWFATSLQSAIMSATLQGSPLPASSLPPLLQHRA